MPTLTKTEIQSVLRSFRKDLKDNPIPWDLTTNNGKERVMAKKKPVEKPSKPPRC